MQYDVFISYSRKDSEVANRICAAFDEVGITYFIDRQGISGGENFTKAITTAIKGSKTFLFLASKNAYGSIYTNKEVNYAIKKKERECLIPYIIDDSELPDELELVLSDINWRRIEEHPVSTALVDDILRLLGKKRTYAVEDNLQSTKWRGNMSTDEILSMFGDIFGGRGGTSRGTDLRVRLKLTPQEMRNGTTRKIKLKKLITCSNCHGSGVKEASKCPHCNGEGVINGEELVAIDILAGAMEKETLMIKGKGNAGKRNGESGDLFVVIEAKNESAKLNVENGHEYVDLGLSVKWATCNIGASSPEDFGDYFAWGEVTPKSFYENITCSTKDKDIIDFSGNPQYDAARAKWQGKWRMPTKKELKELKSQCKFTWTTQKGISGCLVTGPNGNSIFLPAGGQKNGSSLNGEYCYGYYWSSTPPAIGLSRAIYLYIEKYMGRGNSFVTWDFRCSGQNIRPVID